MIRIIGSAGMVLDPTAVETGKINWQGYYVRTVKVTCEHCGASIVIVEGDVEKIQNLIEEDGFQYIQDDILDGVYCGECTDVIRDLIKEREEKEDKEWEKHRRETAHEIMCGI
jgi:hypothetical protein